MVMIIQYPELILQPPEDGERVLHYLVLLERLIALLSVSRESVRVYCSGTMSVDVWFSMLLTPRCRTGIKHSLEGSVANTKLERRLPS